MLHLQHIRSLAGCEHEAIAVEVDTFEENETEFWLNVDNDEVLSIEISAISSSSGETSTLSRSSSDL